MTHVDKAIDEFLALGQGLHDDVAAMLQSLKVDDSQWMRRALFRGVFAHIEGMVYTLKLIALARHADTPVLFTAGELLTLREEVQDLTEAGELKAKPANLRFLPNLQFAFRCFAHSYGISYALPKSERGYEALGKSVRVRNRLTHPKVSTELLVTDTEIDDLKTADLWFIKCRGALLKASAKGTIA